MADQTNAEVAAEAPAKVAETVAETVEKVVAESAKPAKAARAKTSRRAKPRAAPAVIAPPAAKTRRPKTRRPARKTATVAKERTKTVEFNTNRLFAGFDAIPAFEPFKAFFAEANERSQDAVKRSQKVAEELADIARGNVEAFVESGRLATEGARSIGQDVVSKSRASAEAKSPTEFFQLQTELAKSSFDRLVAESSKLTESFVKLAGEAVQPLSTRASVNVERLNDLVA